MIEIRGGWLLVPFFDRGLRVVSVRLLQAGETMKAEEEREREKEDLSRGKKIHDAVTLLRNITSLSM